MSCPSSPRQNGNAMGVCEKTIICPTNHQVSVHFTVPDAVPAGTRLRVVLDTPVRGEKGAALRIHGIAKGKIRMADDFNEPTDSLWDCLQ